MKGIKRTVERPWGRRRNGGWVLHRDRLIEALKKGEAVELDKVTVGTAQLIKLLRLLPYEYCQVSANGRLEIETVVMRARKRADGRMRASYTKPKHYHQWFGLVDGAWLKPYMRTNVVVLKPKKI